MSEDFLYFLWQFQYFRSVDLRTTDGEPIQVIRPGFRNFDAGPDFTDARLLIGAVEWSGTVEAHVRAADWLAHRHQHDRAYNNVILHIVWEAMPLVLCRTDGSHIPTLCLSEITDPALWQRYQILREESGQVACAGQLDRVAPIRQLAMLDKVLLERLERKAAGVMTVFQSADSDWEETTYRLLATAFGFQLNADPFAQLSRLVPLKVVHKHRNRLIQVEALLFGTAGLLQNEYADAYETELKQEYGFLSIKYGLADRVLAPHAWKWSRLRPANFPTLRLAQLAKLITSHLSLFSFLLETEEIPALRQHLQVTPTPYWQTHYRFGQPAEKVPTTLGETAADNLLINVVAPLLVAYSHHKDLPLYRDRAMTLLEQLPAEHNRVTRLWQSLKLPVRTAFDSQAVIELYKNYCQPKKCLFCQIGTALVQR